ncbi:uncharacterized protein LOC106023974 [Esox lucius]|uniref:uncharacterized protein LOC106023974 n=1 Tax=Esox lucius TaxID=8010 RepID=UPI0014768969|nr:uncharacterized protein LOC106023974 [Esox lucius]
MSVTENKSWQDFVDSSLQEKIHEERIWMEKMFSSLKTEVESWIIEMQQEWRLRERTHRDQVYKLLLMDLPQRKRAIDRLREMDLLNSRLDRAEDREERWKSLRDACLVNKLREEKKNENEKIMSLKAELEQQKTDVDRRERKVQQMERDILTKTNEVNYKVISVNRKVIALRSMAENIKKEQKTLLRIQGRHEHQGPGEELLTSPQNQGVKMHTLRKQEPSKVRKQSNVGDCGGGG